MAVSSLIFSLNVGCLVAHILDKCMYNEVYPTREVKEQRNV
jgi:hypothetical protein